MNTDRLVESISKQLTERGVVVRGDLADKVFKKYKNVITKLVEKIGKEFNLHPSVIAIVMEKLFNRHFGAKFHPSNWRDDMGSGGTKRDNDKDWDMYETIKKVDNKYAVYPKRGGKRLGTHSSKSAAQKQLAAIEISKQKRK